ncbi:MAG: hypothetical protein ACXVW3_10415, partial [Nocardioidaceae bacterium]
AAIKVVDYRMIGATGRVYLSGHESDVRAAAEAAEAALASGTTRPETPQGAENELPEGHSS